MIAVPYITPNFPVKAALLAMFCFAASLAKAERVARILYYGAPPSAPEKAFVYTKTGELYNLGDSLKVPLERHNFSKSFPLKSGAIRLGFLPQVLPEGTEFPVSAPGVKIPRTWSKVLLLVSHDPENTVMPIRVKAINASDDSFKAGELYFINFAKATIFGLVGNKKLMLKPMKTAIVSDPADGAGSYQVKLDTIRDGDGETRQWLVRQPWRHDPDIRRVIFIIPLAPPRVAKVYSAPIGNF